MANEKRLIPAEPIKKFIMDGLNNPDPKRAFGHDAIEILTEIEYAPTVDAVEVVHGRWLDVKETDLYVPDKKYTVTHTAETCSVCNVRIGFVGSKLYLYDNKCPNCGAKMDGERGLDNE